MTERSKLHATVRKRTTEVLSRALRFKGQRQFAQSDNVEPTFRVVARCQCNDCPMGELPASRIR